MSSEKSLSNILQDMDCDTTDALIVMLKSRLENTIAIEDAFLNNPHYADKVASYEKSIAPKFKSILERQENLKEVAREALGQAPSKPSRAKRM